MAGEPRLFVAVPVPDAARDDCRRLLENVRAGPADRGARWVRVENLHLTLRFLGATPPERVDAVAAAVVDAVRGAAPFAITLAGAGAFPSAHRPRTLWLGIAEGAPGLAALAAGLEQPLAALGWPPETRPFRAHLTVARTDAAPIADAAAAAAALVRAADRWRTAFAADRVVLYRSHLGGGPPRYEPLATASLGAESGSPPGPEQGASDGP
jgi:2'-5' RNA ligase